MLLVRFVLLGVFSLLLSAAAFGQVSGPAGGGQPLSTIQPSVAVNYLVRTGGDPARLGDIMLFAGDYEPAGWSFAHGQSLLVAANQELFRNIGTSFGGDGVATFNLPDLRGRTPIGISQNTGFTDRPMGTAVGSESVVLTVQQMPAHSHTTPMGETHTVGGSQPVSTMQPSLALRPRIAFQGANPDGATPLIGPDPFLGQVQFTASTLDDQGWVEAGGQLLPNAQWPDLRALLQNRYGGNTTTNFAFPDLRGRAARDDGDGSGTNVALGEVSGTETVTLTTANLPEHVHLLPPAGVSGAAGGNVPHSTLQPSIALNYIIALQGIYPDENGAVAEDGPLIGEIRMFAGDFAPEGWVFADGQLLSITQNPSLYQVLGSSYGGDGRNSFALPDLAGNLVVSFDNRLTSLWEIGERRGEESYTILQSQMPVHLHTYEVPEPSLAGLAIAALMLARRRR